MTSSHSAAQYSPHLHAVSLLFALPVALPGTFETIPPTSFLKKKEMSPFIVAMLPGHNYKLLFTVLSLSFAFHRCRFTLLMLFLAKRKDWFKRSVHRAALFFLFFFGHCCFHNNVLQSCCIEANVAVLNLELSCARWLLQKNRQISDMKAAVEEYSSLTEVSSVASSHLLICVPSPCLSL